jgi:hypothetical protein
MRIAFILYRTDLPGPRRQLCGISGEEALRLSKAGVYELEYEPGRVLHVTIDEAAEQVPPARVGALPWPSELCPESESALPLL